MSTPEAEAIPTLETSAPADPQAPSGFPLERVDIPADAPLRAEACIKNHVIAAMGIGLIPSALVDAVGIAGIEINLIRELAVIYQFPVPTRLVAAKVLLSAAGSLGPVYLSSRARGLFKGVPLLGHALLVGFLSLSGGAAVYAIGKLFERHYVSGGTFLTMDTLLMRDFFREKLAEGKAAIQAWTRPESPAVA